MKKVILDTNIIVSALISNAISDNKFLELALASSADYLITGNVLDFKFKEFQKTLILTPREFWAHFKP